ncbi:MAG: amino acid ABC transporter substrate-binding protein [Spirochaetales bacterium]|nr:amino acid ABC transporter substrate-binding protein [Spirochaetales bacterium]
MAQCARIIPAVLFIAIFAGCAQSDGTAEGPTGPQSTLDVVIERGRLIAGVKVDTPGFGVLNPDGSRSGNDVDFSRAVAAAILGDADAVDFVEATGSNRFELLSSGEIDLLIRTTTWTASRDADLEADFVTTTFYDGAGIMVNRAFAEANGITSALQLDGATIGVLDGTSTQGAVSDFAAENGITLNQQTYPENAPLRQAFIDGVIDAWSSDKSQLGGHQFALQEEGIEAIVLPETLSKEPLGPVTRDNDSEFHDVVQWVVFGMIIAEEEGVTGENVMELAANPPNNTVARLLGVGFDGGAPSDLGIGGGKIPITFMQEVISQVGNYGEVYDRTLEQVGLARLGSLNSSYLDGGLIYAAPMR